MHPRLDMLLKPSRAQAVRPTCHWWLRPRVLAWFRVLVILSLVKRPAAAGPLSRIGDYLLLQHEGLDSGDDLTDAVQYERHWGRMGIAFSPPCTMTRSPPHPLFHRRPDAARHPASFRRNPNTVPPYAGSHFASPTLTLAMPVSCVARSSGAPPFVASQFTFPIGKSETIPRNPKLSRAWLRTYLARKFPSVS